MPRRPLLLLATFTLAGAELSTRLTFREYKHNAPQHDAAENYDHSNLSQKGGYRNRQGETDRSIGNCSELM